MRKIANVIAYYLNMTNHAFECLNVCWGKNLSSVSVHDMISTNLYDQKNVSGTDVFILSITGIEL